MFPLRDANPRHGPAFVTWILLVVNVAVFVMGWGMSREEAAYFVYAYGFVPRSFFSNPFGDAYSLVSSMFLHGGFMHILSNMFFLMVFADNVEDRMGHIPFLLFYLLGGVVATLVHGLFTPRSPIPMIGASGAVSAVLGAYILLFPRQRVLTFIPPFFLFWLPAWLYLGYWAVIQFFNAAGGLVVSSGAADGVAWWAHVGGFLFGAFALSYFVPRRDALAEP